MSLSTPQEVLDELLDRARKLFAEERLEELHPDIERMASELSEVLLHPLDPENAP